MANWWSQPEWSPYWAGAGIGVLSWLAFLFSDKALGCSTPFARGSGLVERLFRGRAVLDKPYYQAHPPALTWDTMLIIGVLLGAFASAWLSGAFELRWVPEVWRGAAGSSPWVRAIAALAGGIAMGFGARWADGCTSGHGISGTLQLAVSGWLAVVCFFVGGIATAMVIFHVLLPVAR
ncbi:MAG: putative inner membrane protein [Lentisphaerae bacterium ADurb.BinA184]|nr:MAG: putative inner membrane protein [Lentisphaerae bacterium ADurb.BinA184]